MPVGSDIHPVTRTADNNTQRTWLLKNAGGHSMGEVRVVHTVLHVCPFIRNVISGGFQVILQVMLQVYARMVTADQDVHLFIWLVLKDTPVALQRGTNTPIVGSGH